MFKAKQAMHAPTKSRNVECLCELQQWVAQVIDSAEKNGDTHKKNKFLALQAELEN
jgi:hypothetical protein